MDAPAPATPPTCAPVMLDATARCDECGASGAYAFAEVTLCLTCYTQRGSCCPEFGREAEEG